MRTTFALASLWLATVNAQMILPVTETVEFTAAAMATGVSLATMVPFNVDITAEPDYRNYEVVEKYSTSVWESKVAVYNDSGSVDTFVSLHWPRGSRGAHVLSRFPTCLIV